MYFQYYFYAYFEITKYVGFLTIPAQLFIIKYFNKPTKIIQN